MPSAKTLALVLAALYAAAAFQPALARDTYRDIMVEEGGKPLRKSREIVVEPGDKPVKKNKPAEPRARPRGSSYVPSTSLPRTEPVVVAPPSPGVYTPPPIHRFGDRVRDCIHSHSLNAGIGNNPTDQGSYIRQCAN